MRLVTESGNYKNVNCADGWQELVGGFRAFHLLDKYFWLLELLPGTHKLNISIASQGQNLEFGGYKYHL